MAEVMSSLPETRASLLWRLPDAGDAAAWEEFVTIYGRAVYRGARRQGLQSADAEDLVQEVFTTVADSIAAWLRRSERGPFRAWLFRIAKNTAINVLTRSRFRAQGGSDAAKKLAEQPDPAGDVPSQFEQEYRRELFRWAAHRVQNSFTEKTWQAFWLSSVEARPIPEVAEHLEMSLGSVYIARSRVIPRLRAEVRKFENEDGP